MANKQAAVVLGASGSVGHAVVRKLIWKGLFSPIVTLVRRPQSDQRAMAREAGVDLREMVLPTMTPAVLRTQTQELVASLGTAVVGLSVLGIGAGTAKMTIDEHRAVDLQLNEAFALGLRLSGRAGHLALMSAAGANASASTNGSGAPGLPRFARVKGEAEEAVKRSGPAVVSIFRPAMIIGSQHTPWLLEKLTPIFGWVMPAKYRSITVDQVAAAMVATSVCTPASSKIYHYPEMIALAR